MRVGVQFCPGVLYPVPAKDGLLVRIRTPGGMVDAEQLRSIAGLSRAFADGMVEITSRSNLQLRAIRPEHVELLAQGIIDAGLLPSLQHDRVRNIAASPLAGADELEIVDVRALVRQLDESLQAECRFVELDPKFSFALHGGGRRFTPNRDDVALECFTTKEGIYFQLLIAGENSGFAISSEHAVPCMLRIARNCGDLSLEALVPARTKHIIVQPDGMKRLLSGLENILLSSPKKTFAPRSEEALVGIQAPSRDGYVTISPTVALGRLTAAQTECLAIVAREYAGDLRLAPWRGVVLNRIRELSSSAVVGKLEEAALSCSGDNGFQGIAACAGSAGCEASHADVRSHAVLLARHLADNKVPAGWAVNLSGCEKQCARRHGATAEMIAGESGYTLKIRGALVATACSSDFALNAIYALHQQSLLEVVS
ncbi:precorrin-3B synthase [Granulicella arctica]|uniref:precorrin-3B synthase n=1 Tax=Granulicella arctica TaxID=940613 RepID=UPI0021E0683D|nr:precorrin-3B synthase [Granulicella arctica]